MGYRIGYQCFVSNEAAHDYLLSQQPPTITSEGLLIRPVKQGQDWYLNGQKIQLSFPECSLEEQIQLGAELAAPIIGIVSLIFLFRQIYSLIRSMSEQDEKPHDWYMDAIQLFCPNADIEAIHLAKPQWAC